MEWMKKEENSIKFIIKKRIRNVFLNFKFLKQLLVLTT
jgi:hypothetical protein